jgi:iron complex transport system permease protein
MNSHVSTGRDERARPDTEGQAAHVSLKLLRLPLGVTLLIGLLAATFAANLALGSVNIPLGDIITILLGGEPAKASWRTIVLDVRLSDAITAALAGAALAVSGLQMQTFFRNPLAGPFIIGVSSGASLGVAAVVLSGGVTLLATAGLGGAVSITLAAGAGAALVMGLVMVIARYVHSNMTLLIVGVMIGYATGAVVSILMYFSQPEQINTYIRWGFGSFSAVHWSTMRVFAPVLVAGLVLAFLLSKSLNALLLGEAYAHSMGLQVQRARLWIILSTALLAGTVTAFCGPVGFIGLAVPHLCRGLFNSVDHRLLVPACALLGATIALMADIIAGMPGNMEMTLPLNAVTALIGAPVVVWVILRQRNAHQTFAG